MSPEIQKSVFNYIEDSNNFGRELINPIAFSHIVSDIAILGATYQWITNIHTFIEGYLEALNEPDSQQDYNVARELLYSYKPAAGFIALAIGAILARTYLEEEQQKKL